MEESRLSDISKTQLELIDLSTADQSLFPMATAPDDDDDSMHPDPSRGPKHSGGFCVKDYEDKMEALTKENFNLKLRIYFLQEKNPNVPEGSEQLYKQNIDLKIENETLMKELQEKQDLLCQASKALELLDEQKSNDLRRSEIRNDELIQKIESLNHEIVTLQNANKSCFGNDTGYADFLGAVDTKDIELQRANAELEEFRAQMTQLCDDMNDKIAALEVEKKDIQAKASNLLYENDEMKDKIAQFENIMTEQTSKLEDDLRDYKDKWASTQCDLQDSDEKLKQTESDRAKTMSLLREAITNLEAERQKVYALEIQFAENCTSGLSKEATIHNSADQQTKEKEIAQLQDELKQVKRQLNMMTTQELNEKNREIEKLRNLMANMQVGRNSLISPSARFSLEQLSDSFNDLKFQQAMEEKKRSQQKIDELMNELADVATSQTKEHVTQLQEQMAIVVEKQEVTDSALEKCAELCAFTMDHLQELAHFLKCLLQQKDIRESISEATMLNMQSAIDKTLEFSQNAGRFSASIDGRMSSLPNISSLDLLMTTARESLANAKVLQISDKSVQASNDQQVEMLQEEAEAARKELDDINRVNQVLEDEICKLKEMLQEYKQRLQQRDEEIVEIKASKDAINLQLQQSQEKLNAFEDRHDELKEKLTTETKQKFEFELRLESSESLAAKLQEKLETLRKDLEKNWITKDEHDAIVKRLEQDIVAGEAEAAAIRMQMDAIRESYSQSYSTGLSEMEAMELAAAPDTPDGNKENMTQPTIRRTLEISEDRKLLLTGKTEPIKIESIEASSAVVAKLDSCKLCPKYQSKIVDLKKYLVQAMEKLKFQSEMKARNDRHIQKQLSNTESFLSQARVNMENILKTQNSDE